MQMGRKKASFAQIAGAKNIYVLGLIGTDIISVCISVARFVTLIYI